MGERSRRRRDWKVKELQDSRYGFASKMLSPFLVGILDSLLEPYFTGSTNCLVVEIGSGLGPMSGLSRFSSAFVVTDSSHDIVRHRRSLGERVRRVRIQNIVKEFGAHSIDLVFGINVLDCLSSRDLRLCLAALMKSLRPGGTLLHILDRNAHHATIERDLRSAGWIAFPVSIGGRYGVVPLRASSLHGEIGNMLDAILGKRDVDELRLYAKRPTGAYDDQILHRDREDIDRIARRVHIAASLAGDIVYNRDLNDIFHAKLSKAASFAGFDFREPVTLRKSGIVPGDGADTMGKNWIVTEKGFLFAKQDPLLAPNLTRIDVELAVWTGRADK